MADENNITTLAKRLRPFIKLAAQQVIVVDPGDHGLLTGLIDDDHSQYVHISTARTITAKHSFSPAGSQAPFDLGANAQGQTVVGLKADQLNKSVTAGAGLTGGGGLNADISLAVGAGAGLTVNADDVALTTPGTLSVGSSNNPAGSHTHAITSNSDPGAAASLLASDASGFLKLVKLYVDTLVDKSGGNLTIAPAGDVTFNPGGNDLLPYTNYDLNLGAINKKYLTLHAAELWVETLVSHDTLATIGGRILVAPTTTLTRDLPAANTSFYVKHNQIANGDRVYLEANGNVEWIAVTSAGTLQGEGDYLYSITRNLDGSGANDWYAGDAVLNTGQSGDGYIDIYSTHSVRSVSHIGPTIVGNIRTGSIYSDLIEGWAIGNLNGLYGYGADIYGVGLGKYANSSSYVTIEPTGGVQLKSKSSGGTETVKIKLDIDGDVFVGSDISAAATTGLAIFSNSQTYNGETTVLAGDILIGDNTAGKANIYWDKADGKLNFRSGPTVSSYVDIDGGFVVNDPGGGIFDRTAAITWNNESGDIGTLGSYSSGSFIGVELKTLPIAGKYSNLSLKAESPANYSAEALLKASNGGGYFSSISVQVGSSGDRKIWITAHEGFYLGSNETYCDLYYSGKMVSWRSTGLQYDTWPYHPLTVPLSSTSWDGDLYATQAATLVDLSAVFGAPPEVKAVNIALEIYDTYATSGNYYVWIGPSQTDAHLICFVHGSSLKNTTTGFVTCNADGDVYVRILAGSGTSMSVKFTILGYCL